MFRRIDGASSRAGLRQYRRRLVERLLRQFNKEVSTSVSGRRVADPAFSSRNPLPMTHRDGQVLSGRKILGQTRVAEARQVPLHVGCAL